MSNYAENKKIYFDYEILEKYEAGIQLLGTEVKSIRAGRMLLKGSFVIIRGGEAFLINAQIPAYQEKNAPTDYDPLRNRTLLLSKKEILELALIDKNKSLTIVPISVYNSKRKIKIGIAVAKGKKQYDKRESIKKRDIDRENKRGL
ncbi:MAG: SsrA-binding protein SmpB [Patescibacteria group bacterium]